MTLSPLPAGRELGERGETTEALASGVRIVRDQHQPRVRLLAVPAGHHAAVADPVDERLEVAAECVLDLLELRVHASSAEG